MIAIIGGTGLGEAFTENAKGDPIDVDTPFGPPSAPILRTEWAGVPILFLNRHGEGHRWNPSTVPYRANIFALKVLGATTVIASGAVGSLQAEIEPAHLVVCDQVIDKTYRRAGTFYHDEMVVHVELADPFCPVLRRRLLDHVKAASTVVHDHGTYVCMEGPQFSTRAESNMHRAWGGTLVGMTVMPEAKLAREAELSYAHVALVTDYDCWRPQDGYDKQALLAEIIGNLKSGTHNAIAMIQATVASLAKDPIRESPAFDALNMALWTDTKAVPRRAVERLQPLIGRLFADKG